MEKIISLTEMKTNESGTFIELVGGQGMIRNLENMGIRIGTEIKKISQQMARGPVVISQGNIQVAIGYSMAKRIRIEKKK